MAVYSLFAIAGTGTGPIVAGWIEMSLGWRWIQWFHTMYALPRPRCCTVADTFLHLPAARAASASCSLSPSYRRHARASCSRERPRRSVPRRVMHATARTPRTRAGRSGACFGSVRRARSVRLAVFCIFHLLAHAARSPPPYRADGALLQPLDRLRVGHHVQHVRVRLSRTYRADLH